jgi:hypothetical protein
MRESITRKLKKVHQSSKNRAELFSGFLTAKTVGMGLVVIGLRLHDCLGSGKGGRGGAGFGGLGKWTHSDVLPLHKKIFLPSGPCDSTWGPVTAVAVLFFASE